MDRIRETFNDGVLLYGSYITQRTENRKRAGRKFAGEGRLNFRVINARDNDYLECGALGSSLDLKVKTPMPPSLKGKQLNNYKVQIEGHDYDVIKGDRDKHYLYLYLHKVGGTNE